MPIFACLLILCCGFSASNVVNGHRQTSNIVDGSADVTKFGAVGDGKADDTKAFAAAWAAACNQMTKGGAKVTVPQGKTYFVNQIRFSGPCKSSLITFQILGTIVAPTKSTWKGMTYEYWLNFYHVNGLNVLGNGIGVIDGQGSSWWRSVKTYRETSSITDRPTALRFTNCTTLQVSGLKHVNSPRNHVTLSYCNGVKFKELNMIAPKDSPNTDGIDIAHSTSINIYHCTMQTGDDCIAIKGGSSNINITNVARGPGHGISVGSLGLNGHHDEVQQVHVSNCRFNGTLYGARIKTYMGGSGFARDISFSDITLIKAYTPIIIDQFYGNGSKTEGLSAVQISGVTYTRIHGTTISKEASINFSCSATKPCTHIIMDNISITSATSVQPTSYCINAQVTARLTKPAVHCKAKIQSLNGEK